MKVKKVVSARITWEAKIFFHPPVHFEVNEKDETLMLAAIHTLPDTVWKGEDARVHYTCTAITSWYLLIAITNQALVKDSDI